MLSETSMQRTRIVIGSRVFYLPGNTQRSMINLAFITPTLILDLEDAVAPEKKAEADFLLEYAQVTLASGAEKNAWFDNHCRWDGKSSLYNPTMSMLFVTEM